MKFSVERSGPPPVILKGRRIELRSMYPEGPVSALANWLRDPAFASSLNLPAGPWPDDQVRAYLAGFDNRRRMHLGAYDMRRSVQVGFTALDIDEAHAHGHMHISVGSRRDRIAPIVVEMGLLTMGWAFGTRRLAKVTCQIDAARRPFAVLLEGLGFPLEAVLRSHIERADGSGRSDLASYGVTAADWPAVRAAMERRISGDPSASGSVA